MDKQVDTCVEDIYSFLETPEGLEMRVHAIETLFVARAYDYMQAHVVAPVTAESGPRTPFE